MVNQHIDYESQEDSTKNKLLSVNCKSNSHFLFKNIAFATKSKFTAISVKKNKDIILHSIMCSIGGFMCGYGLLCRGNLGSAQTMNMIDIVFGIMGENKDELLLRLIGLLLYLAGIEFVILFSKKTHINLKRYSIVVDMVGFLILAAIPDKTSTVVGLFPMFFMLSTQWCVFSGTRGYTSSSVFSTNNLRQTIFSLNEYAFSKDKEQLIKAIFFINTLFWFHVNIFLSYFSVKYFGVYASLFGFIYVVPAFIITYIKDEKI